MHIDNNTLIDNADLDTVMLMHNLLEYNHNMTSGTLSNYYRNEIDDVDVNGSVSNGKRFKYKTKVVGETPERPPQLENP